MALIAIFFLGIGNFALHKAVMESGHRLLGQLPVSARGAGRRVLFGTEFLILLVAMLLAANGWPGLVWAYLVYTLANGASAWLILTGRI